MFSLPKVVLQYIHTNQWLKVNRILLIGVNNTMIFKKPSYHESSQCSYNLLLIINIVTDSDVSNLLLCLIHLCTVFTYRLLKSMTINDGTVTFAFITAN